jgi:hypothetical protein
MLQPLRASPPPKTVNKLLCFRIENSLMITVLTHKRVVKVPLNTQRPFIYVFTSGRVIGSGQIHSRKKAFKGGV